MEGVGIEGISAKLFTFFFYFSSFFTTFARNPKSLVL